MACQMHNILLCVCVFTCMPIIGNVGLVGRHIEAIHYERRQNDTLHRQRIDVDGALVFARARRVLFAPMGWSCFRKR